jgi:hypothetical protein
MGIEKLVNLIRDPNSRWWVVGDALHEAVDSADWKAAGAPSANAWLDQLAALGGRSTTYLSRCMSAARYISQLKASGLNVDESQLAARSLSVVEELRRRAGTNLKVAANLLPQVQSGRLKYHDFRRMSAEDQEPRRRSERTWFAKAVEEKLPDLLPVLNCSPDSVIQREPRTPLGTPDAVCWDPTTGSTTLIEVKTALSWRSLSNIVQQLLAYAHLAERAWLIMPSDSEIPAEAIIKKLRDVAVKHVGLLLLDPAEFSVEKVIPVEADAAPSNSSRAFKQLVFRPDLAPRAVHQRINISPRVSMAERPNEDRQ